MKKMMRRWISMLMVVLMTIAMVPMQAFAATCTATINFRVIPVYEDATKPSGYDVDYDSDWKGTISCTYTSTHSTNANHQIPIKEFHPDKVLSGKIRSGYTWKGWNKYNININSVNATYSAYVSNSNTTSFSGTGTHYIYMVYKSNTPTYNYSLKYNLNGGTGNFPDQTENNSTATSKNFTIHSGTPNRDNFEFLGWSDGTTTYQPGGSITLTSAAPSKTLTAQWTPKQTEAPKFKVTYKDGDTTVLNSPLSYDKGSEVTVLGLEDKNDATFLGWNTTKGATTADWAEEDTFTINADITFYAVWKAKETDPTDPTDPTNPTDPATEYTITYKNGDETIDTVTVPAGGDANVRDGLTDDEKEFSYWLGDDGNIYRPGEEITGINKNYVLTAVWKGEEPDPGDRDKVNKPGIDKKVDNADRTVVKPGETVNFTLESNVPDNLSDYVDWQADPWNIVNPSTGEGGAATEPENTDTPENPETPVNSATVNGDVPARYAEIARNNADSASGENKEITKGSYVLTFHDVMSAGLTMNNSTLKVSIDDNELAADDYTFTTTNEDQCSFEISMDLVKLFNEKKFDLNTDTVVRKILVTYSANYSGEEGEAGDGFKSTNKAWVDYTDKDPEDPDTPHVVEVVTGSISVIKIDQDTHKALDGAEFELYLDKAGTQQVGDTVTTDGEGKASFGSLKAGTYYLKETKAPDGYVGREGLQEVTITAQDGKYLITYEVPNKYVPHTGGAGTRMFTILGLAIMAGAGAAFVISRRKRED